MNYTEPNLHKTWKYAIDIHCVTFLHVSTFKAVQVRAVTPGRRASSTLSQKGFIGGCNTAGMSSLILLYSINISRKLQNKTLFSVNS